MPPGNIISPFVSDLSKLSHGKVFSVCSGGTCVIRCALLNTACDLPPGRRACGFFSFSANLGCSRGYHNFGTSIFLRKQNYSGFDQQAWQFRSNVWHRPCVKTVLECTTESERKEKESELGCCYSCLLELP